MTGLPIANIGDDYAKNPGMSVQELAGMMRDIDYQPRWRSTAEIDADYYDSNQLDSKILQLMEERGIPPIVINLTKPSIDLILGMEEKTRRDWVVRADDDKDVDFAAAMTKELQWAERGTRADVACSRAYASQVKSGLGWVHVRKERMNPFRFPYVVEHVHRREIWWDWFDEDDLLRQARWLVRRKWYDQDVVTAMWPQHKQLIAQISAGWDQFEYAAEMDVAHPLYQDWVDQRDFTWGVDEWANPDRKRLAIYEVWYRKWGRGYVIRTQQGGHVATFDEKNPTHRALVEAGVVELEATTVPEVRLSYWCGPHRLADIPSPLPHEDFPYIPFWGYREDRTNAPYGHIRQMRPLQDEINARRSRMLWQLAARRLVALDSVVKDKRAVELEMARPDSAIYLDASKMGSKSIGDVFQVDDNQALNAQQFSAYQDAKMTIQDVANVFKEQLGKAGAAESGIAISQLIEQGTMSLASLNMRYTTAREAVGQHLYALRSADIGNEERKVTIDKAMGQKKTVTLNEKKLDDLGIAYRSNSVAMTKASVVLEHVQASSTYRQFQFKELVNLAKGLPSPELQAAVLDMVIEASDVPYKDDLAQRVRDSLGIQNTDVESMTDEELAAYEQKMEAQELMDKIRETMALLTQERADLENRQIDAETEKTEAETVKIKAEASQVEAGDNPRIPGADPNRLPERHVA